MLEIPNILINVPMKVFTGKQFSKSFTCNPLLRVKLVCTANVPEGISNVSSPNTEAAGQAGQFASVPVVQEGRKEQRTIPTTTTVFTEYNASVLALINTLPLPTSSFITILCSRSNTT